MAFSTTWSVDKYKSEYESLEHWELRRKFMEAHKDTFPEDKLVCLARVFFNVEFLGCRYPEKTMQLVSDLSKGVADEFREKKKGKLKRTFVQASDAAGAKIKGSSSEPLDKISKTIQNNSHDRNSLYSCFVHSNVVKSPEPSDFPGLIIYENCRPNGDLETCPINILTQTVQKNQGWKDIKFDFPPEKNAKEELNKFCEISIDNTILSSASGLTQKEARLNAAIEGLKVLRKSCFTIQAKHAFFSDNPEVGKDEATKKTRTEEPLPQDNVGCKMMQKMGWTGTGLGKQQQGIETPIQASAQNVQRAGFGGTDQKKFHSNCKQILKEYIASSSDHDLVFSPDYSSEERKILHQPSTDDDNYYKEDLFESYQEILGTENSSDEDSLEMSNNKVYNNISSCIVCNKMKTINGEESDDDILDDMWGTGSDTTGLTQDFYINHRIPTDENDETYNNETDDEICDMDVSDDFQDLNGNVEDVSDDCKELHTHVDIPTHNLGDDNNSESIIQPRNSLTKSAYENSQSIAGTSTFSLNSFIKGEFSIFKKSCCTSQSLTVGSEGKTNEITRKFVKICYKLLNQSFVSICLKCIKEDEVLNLFTFPNGHRLIPLLCVNVTKNDFENNPLLWGTLMKYAVCRKIPNDKSYADTVNLNNQSSGSQTTYEYNISPPIPSLRHAQVSENETNSSKITELDLNCRGISNQMEQKNNQTSVSICSETMHPNLITLPNENIKIKIILPDGSYKRIPLDTIKNNPELIEFTKYSKNQLLDSKIKVTFEDLKKYKALHSLFADFISCDKPNDLIIKEADHLKNSPLEENYEHSLWEKSALENSAINTLPEQNELQHNGKQDCGECSLTIIKKDASLKGTADTNSVNIIKELTTPNNSLENDSIIRATIPRATTIEKVNLSHQWDPHSIPAPSLTQLNITRKKQNPPTIKFILLDGSFKRVPISVVEENEQLREFTNYHPESKVFNFKVTEKHFEKYSELKKIFSDFVLTSENSKHDSCSSSTYEFRAVNDSPNVVSEPSSSAKISERHSNTVSVKEQVKDWPVELVDNSLGSSKVKNEPNKYKQYKACRLTLKRKGGGYARVNSKHLEGNKYFMRYLKRRDEIKAFNLTFQDVPPPIYSDSSSDEGEWLDPRRIRCLKGKFLETSIEGKTYLNNQWEQFLNRFSNSNKNPLANKWNEYVDKIPLEEKYCILSLAEKWKEFMTLKEEKSKINLNNARQYSSHTDESDNSTSSSLKIDVEHLDVPLCNNSSDTTSIIETDSTSVGIASDQVKRKLLTSHFPIKSYNTGLFGVNINSGSQENYTTDVLNQYSLESGTDESQHMLENHLKSSAVTTIMYSSVLENSITVMPNNHENVLNLPSDKHKNKKDPNIISMYLFDGSKIKLDRRIFHPDFLNETDD